MNNDCGCCTDPTYQRDGRCECACHEDSEREALQRHLDLAMARAPRIPGKLEAVMENAPPGAKLLFVWKDEEDERDG